ncbi:MAG: hypothetical protein QXO75_10180, partial [Nitrososphaerota archaeon]
MTLSKIFWLFIGFLIGLLLLPVLIVGGLLLLLAMVLMPYIIPFALIIVGGLLILIGLTIL